MRTKMVKRHWCDFCNKAGLSASAMARHEKHCTMNPNRACRVCGMVADGRDSDFVPQTVAQLSALLPTPVTIEDDFGSNGSNTALRIQSMRQSPPCARLLETALLA